MSKAKRKKKFAAQQKAASAISVNRDLEKKPLTGAEILALPRSERPYPKRIKSESGRGLGYSGAGFDPFGILIFLVMWAVCSLVMYGVYTALGMMSPYTLIAGIVSGLFGTMIIRSGGAGLDVTNWW